MAAVAACARRAALAPTSADALAEVLRTDPEAGAARVAAVALAAAAPAKAEAWAEAKMALLAAQARLHAAAPVAWSTYTQLEARSEPGSESLATATQIAAAQLRAAAPSATEDWEAARVAESTLQALVVLAAPGEWAALEAALDVVWR